MVNNGIDFELIENLRKSTINYINEHGLDDYAKQQIREIVSDFRAGTVDRRYAKEIFKNNSKEKAIEYLNQYSKHLPKKITEDQLDDIKFDEDLIAEYQKSKNDKEFEDILSIDKNEKIKKKWDIQDGEELVTFYNGTSKTRAEHFLTKGTGGTKLESVALINDGTAVSEIGLQVMFSNDRAAGYGRRQSELTEDIPVIIQGKIKAKYLHPGNNWGYEYAIPKEYYDKIAEAKILHAETGEELYHLKDGKLINTSKNTEKITKDVTESININNNKEGYLNVKPTYADVSGRTYITYGVSEFDVNKFNPIKNSGIKPSGGFWASPSNTNAMTWKDWLEWEMPEWLDRYSDSVEFTLKPDTRLLEINTLEKLNNVLGTNVSSKDSLYHIDFEKLATEYDAIQFNVRSNFDELYWPLYGWDIDSLVIFNPDVVQTMPKPVSPTVLSPQEAFDRYGPNSDEFYTSQGLDPKQQREAIDKLNSGRKQVDNTPVEVKQFQEKLDKLGITEDEYYKRFNEEMMPKKKKYKAIKSPKLKSKEQTKGHPIFNNPKVDEILDEVGDDFDEYYSIFSRVKDPEKAHEIWKQNRKNNAEPTPDISHKEPTKPKPVQENTVLNTEQVVEPTVKSVPTSAPKPASTPKPKPVPTPTPIPKSNNIPNPSPKPQIQMKSLNGGGKGSLVGLAVAGVAGLVVGKAISDNNRQKQQNRKANRQTRDKDVQSQQIDNSYAMQMAQDISSYRYGKHMTGFVNF